jgi:hypothetical protein
MKQGWVSYKDEHSADNPQNQLPELKKAVTGISRYRSMYSVRYRSAAIFFLFYPSGSRWLRR